MNVGTVQEAAPRIPSEQVTYALAQGTAVSGVAGAMMSLFLAACQENASWASLGTATGIGAAASAFGAAAGIFLYNTCQTENMTGRMIRTLGATAAIPAITLILAEGASVRYGPLNIGVEGGIAFVGALIGSFGTIGLSLCNDRIGAGFASLWISAGLGTAAGLGLDLATKHFTPSWPRGIGILGGMLSAAGPVHAWFRGERT